MGDRTYCTLTVTGETDRETWKRITSIIDEELCPSDVWDNQFSCEDVNYGLLPSEVSDAIEAAGLSYEWWWGSGDEYSPGITLYDAETKSKASFIRDDHYLLLRLNEAEDPEKRAEARKWQKWISKEKELVIR